MAAFGAVALVGALLGGCGPDPAALAPPVKAPPVEPPPRARVVKTPAKAPTKVIAAAAPQLPAPASAQNTRPAPPVPERTLADLVERAKAAEFNLLQLDEGKIAAAGIRKLTGRHLTLYTDLPAAAEIDELPAAFDAALPLWAAYFDVAPDKLTGWQLVGCAMSGKERFAGAGLYPERLPDFPHGYSQGSQLWFYDQPSGYYRRHLLLHEGTHCFMNRWLGGAGPPWYMEGIAELLATHHWAGGKLTLGIMPATKEELPYWGRVKIVKDELKEGRGLTLLQIMQYDAHAHLRQEPYGWCWAAAAFLDGHPLTQAAFRELKSHSSDRSIDFSQSFLSRLKDQWPAIAQDWSLFVQDCDYGYDFARSAVVHKPASPLPAAGTTVTVETTRGWQSAGVPVEAGRSYLLSAAGRYQIVGGEKPWPCEAGGVTIRYHAGRPLGLLLASVDLAEFATVGSAATLKPTRAGQLYFKINEASSGLADNSGSLSVTIQPAP